MNLRQKAFGDSNFVIGLNQERIFWMVPNKEGARNRGNLCDIETIARIGLDCEDVISFCKKKVMRIEPNKIGDFFTKSGKKNFCSFAV